MVSQRISHSVLDPWLTLPLKSLYRWLPIPARFPPEGIVVAGHCLAVVAACGFAWSADRWWGGLVAAFGVAGNHIADCLDGTHARATNQCRNGGELLDHFFDPLSFSYWLAGIAVSCGRLDWGLAAVIGLYATAVLTNIKAKMIGEFTLARFGPTEFKTLLVVFAGLLSVTHAAGSFPWEPRTIVFVFLAGLVVFGVIQLAVQLIAAVRDVNRRGAAPDTDEWVTVRQERRS